MAWWKIDNIDMPKPAFEGVITGTAKMWAPNSGRTQMGGWVGTVNAVKRTVKITLPINISTEDRKRIKALMSDGKNAYHSAEYTNEFGEVESMAKCYLNDYETTVSYMTPDRKKIRCKKLEVHLIEV